MIYRSISRLRALALGLIVALTLVSALSAARGADEAAAQPAQTSEVTIGALLSLTGDW